MQTKFDNKGISTLNGVIIILVFTILVFGSIFIFERYLDSKNDFQPIAITNPETMYWDIYKNDEYGFRIKFPDYWRLYSLENKFWSGQLINDLEKSFNYTGPLLVFKNQDLANDYNFQGIPIMIFTPDVWKLVQEEKIAVSAAPIGPEIIGQNAKYIFALPPRWIGFADNLFENEVRYNEVQKILKTFKTF
jgi:hypothetical protein